MCYPGRGESLDRQSCKKSFLHVKGVYTRSSEGCGPLPIERKAVTVIPEITKLPANALVDGLTAKGGVRGNVYQAAIFVLVPEDAGATHLDADIDGAQIDIQNVSGDREVPNLLCVSSAYPVTRSRGSASTGPVRRALASHVESPGHTPPPLSAECGAV